MELIIYDNQIFAVNRNKAENFSDSLVYKAKDGFHQIDFEECAKNFELIYSTSNNRCIGERNILSPQSGLKGVRPPVEFEERPRDALQAMQEKKAFISR